MYRTKKEEEEYRKLYFEDLMVELLERVNKLEKDDCEEKRIEGIKSENL